MKRRGFARRRERSREKKRAMCSPAAAQSSTVLARRMLDLTAFRMASGDAASSSACLLLLLLLTLGTHSASGGATLIEGSPESIAPSSTTTERPYTKNHAGRHVCTKEQAVTEPVKTRESYCYPSYKLFYSPCDDGLCKRYRVVYETAFRDVVKYHVSHKTSYACCPGWAQGSKANHGCTKAVCNRKCENDGSCLKPDFCGCRPGYGGRYCEQDVDECDLRQHTCSQLCINTFGSYHCQCRQGYVLHPDGKNCQLKESREPPPPSTTTEAPKERDREELEDYDFTVEFVNLNKRINKIEKLMKPTNETMSPSKRYSVTAVEVLAKLETLVESQKILKSRMDTLDKKMEQSRKQVNRRNKKWAGEEESRLHHITRQIAVLNQRLDNCACGANNNINK